MKNFIRSCFILLFLQVAVSFNILSSNNELQTKLSAVIDQMVTEVRLDSLGEFFEDADNTVHQNASMVSSLCQGLKSRDECERVGCCQSKHATFLYNVQIRNGQIHFFNDEEPSTNPLDLSPIKSYIYGAEFEFDMPVVHVKGKLDLETCTKFFPGTLHIAGIKTINNAYHIVADNIFPMVAQILLDSVVDKEFLHQPRMFLSGISPSVGTDDLKPLMKLFESLMSAGSINYNQVDGMCFERIVWGKGPLIMYLASRSFLRRVVSDFMRNFVTELYGDMIANPFPSLHQLPSSVVKKGPLNLVIYSRGDSGQRRSIAGEMMLKTSLESLGHNVLICSNYTKFNLPQQISYAYYADGILGMHGAALVHGIFAPKHSIFIELKTIYAYESIVFSLVADARDGVYGSVDIRNYSTPTGHRPVDTQLVDRVNVILQEASKFGKRENVKILQNVTYVTPANKIRQLVDYIAPSSYYDQKNVNLLDSLLGPRTKDVATTCQEGILKYHRAILGFSENADQLHCDSCKNIPY